jgi:hypothetical protein
MSRKSIRKSMRATRSEPRLTLVKPVAENGVFAAELLMELAGLEPAT